MTDTTIAPATVPAEPEAPPMLATSVERLRALFGAVLPHVQTTDDEDEEPTMPPLDCVNVDVFGGYLHLIGSDRYTIAVVRERLDDCGSDVTRALALSVEQINHTLAKLNDDQAVLVIVGRSRIRLLQKGVGFDLNDVGPEIPRLPWRKPLRDAIAAHQAPYTSSLAVNPKYLARLDAARALAPEGTPIRLFNAPAEGKPGTGLRRVVATLTDLFIAVIASVSDDGSAHTWADALDLWRDTAVDVPAA